MRDQSGELPTVRSGGGEEKWGGVFDLLVVQGPDSGKTLAVNGASATRVLVGKSPVCGFRLDDPSVSRRHASLRASGQTLVLMDLGSTNGTFVNNVGVREAFLRGGESIKIGGTVITVSAAKPAAVFQVQDSSFGRMLGESAAMRAIYPLLHHAAGGDFAVLLEGEGGSGKRLCAEEIHTRSKRGKARFVAVECRDTAPDEIEARLFGEGGLFDDGAGGTVYLDEVAALPAPIQQRLLAVVGPSPTAPRLVCGTRHDLDRDIAAGRFREDLLGALASTRIELPPLRDREGDVALLARSFWTSLAAEAPEGGPSELPADFLAQALDYPWPGNVRELLRAVHTRFCLGEFGRWKAEGVRKVGEDAFNEVLGRELHLSEAKEIVVHEFERRYVQYMLEKHGSTKEAARASGIAQRYFQLLIARGKA
jgi:DNA-binding NtrC family response regulator